MLWIPEQKEPLLTDEAEVAMFEKIAAEGLVHVASKGFYMIRAEHSALGLYLNEFGSRLNHLSNELDWPERALKMGASLTALAYHERGFYQTVDEETVATGVMLAEIGGIPETYVVSASIDPVLVDFNAEVTRMDGLRDDEGGMAQVFHIGSGIARHYMQQAIAS
jgi:hypothetical protein